MFKYLVYIEKDIAELGSTKSILKKLGNPKPIFINHYKDVFNQTATDWRNQKAAQKIILAKRTKNFYYTGADITPNFGFNRFYYNTLALNCIYDCQYCYLQGLFTSAHMVLFVNNHDFITETKKLLDSQNQPIYLALSYDTDLLAIENWYPYCKEWIEFARQNPNLTIEIRTKSININALKNITPHSGVILSWTVSPQTIIDLHEPKTPNLTARINAIKTALSQGWRVRVCFDPIIHINKWQNIYTNMVQEFANQIDLNLIDSFSIGVFRMNNQFLKRIKKQRSDAGLLFYPYQTTNEEIATYPTDIKTQMIDCIKSEIEKFNPNATIEIL